MAPTLDPVPLEAFFEEVKEQLGIQLKYLPDNAKFPIQLENSPIGLSRNKCVELLQFIKGQVDLRDNEIGQLYASKSSGKFLLDISMDAAITLSDVYALSFFYQKEPEEETPPTPPKTKKRINPKNKKD